MPVRKPKPLKPGDLIRIVTPASPLPQEKLKPALDLFESEGYRVELGKHALDVDEYLAGTDEHRAEDMQDAFDDPSVSAVFCARGGYGCARLMPYLDLERMAASGKLFCGFSDITTLHIALNQLGLPTLHSPMPITLFMPREEWVYESLKRVLKGDVQLPEGAPNGETVNGGIAEGEVIGGCLCLICDSIGTRYPFDPKGKIVVIEDVDEAPHRIDAMLTHLLNTGLIQHVAGLVIGEMTRTDERIDEGIGGKSWRHILTERLGPLGIPMILNYPFGHAPQMLSLPLGIRARLDADAGKLTYLESLCDG
ncbi:MAG: LD-carboxypeptidase [Fimbriimonadaceae bacterium]|nr:LD-carboxypeptidase [Fimbriimonadaceae bacterium]